ncbi:MAG: beta-eliminating lyase-related protein [Anaeromyxobacter sp.]
MPRLAPDDLDRYRPACTRFLGGHGLRTASEQLAVVPAATATDTYGAGGVVAGLEAEVARLLGKPAAVFMPSGTMAQQIALRIHGDRHGSRRVAWHPTCHLELHEERAFERLHGLEAVKVGDPRKLFTLSDLRRVEGPLAAVLFELPQRELGGVLPAWKDLCAQVAHVRRRGVAAHLDGARLWESTPFYRRTPAEVAALFDTVYVSFYKGLGAVAGACLAGPNAVVEEARLWRKRHGGTPYGLWPYAAVALEALRLRLPRMPAYRAHARAIARALRAVPGVTVIPDPPHTNMMRMLLTVTERRLRGNACRIARERGVYTLRWNGPGPTRSTRLVELSVGDATLGFAPGEVAEFVKALVA